MSVSLLSEKELSELSYTLTTNKDVQEFVKTLPFFAKRNEGYLKESAEDFIGRAIWYGYIANVTAYNVQYRENQPIDFEMEETEEGIDLSDAIDSLSHLHYNIFTNDGNSFLMAEWEQVIAEIKEEFRED